LSEPAPSRRQASGRDRAPCCRSAPAPPGSN
jgi:hypothetical protein